MENYVISLVLGVVMALLLMASNKKAKRNEEGNMIIRLPRFYPILGIVCLMIGIGFIIYSIGWAPQIDVLPAAISGVIAATLGLLLYAKGFISNIVLNDNALIETTIFGKKKVIEWNSITDVSFGKVSLELKIKSGDKKIKAHYHMIGFRDLAFMVETKTGRSMRDIGVPL